MFFYLLLNKRLSKPSIHRWFETPSRSLWRYCNDCCVFFSVLHWIPFIMHKFVSIPLRTCISLQIIMWIHGPSVRFLHQLHDRNPFSCFELPLTGGNFGMDWCKRQFSWSMLRPVRGQWYVASIMMTSSNGNIFRVIGPLCGEFTGHRWIPSQRPLPRSFIVLFNLRLDKRLSKHSRRWWFETPSSSLWRHWNDFCILCQELSMLFTLYSVVVWYWENKISLWRFLRNNKPVVVNMSPKSSE